MPGIRTVIGLAAALVLPGSASSPRPPGAEPLAGPLRAETIEWFVERNLGGARVYRQPVTGYKANRPHSFKRPIKDRMSSVRWHLPEGVVCVLYEHSGGRGRQLAVWGSGRIGSVAPWAFEDVLSGWAWYYVGGAETPPQRLLRARASRPLGARPARALPGGDAMLLFERHEFKGRRAPVDGVTDRPRGQFHGLAPELESTLNSLRWDLPLGVVVVFSERPHGQGRQFVVWGQGEISALRRWGGTGTVASWAWFTPG